MSNIDKQEQYASKFSRLWERFDEASHGNAEQMRDILEVTLDALESAERNILRLEKLAEAESVGADKAAASGVEWMKRCQTAEKRIAELEALAASMEQEPVAWLLSGGGAKNNVSFDSGNAYADPLREVTPLYTAPPAPVALTSGYSDFEEIWSSSTHPLTQDDEMKDFAWDIWNACRAAMLQGADGNSQVMNDYPETLPCPVSLEPGLKLGKGVATKILLEALQSRANYSAEIEVIKEVCRDIKDGDFLAAAKINSSSELVTTAYKLPKPIKDHRLNSGPDADDYYAGYQAGWNDSIGEAVICNSPVIPDGWVMVPVELTGAMTNAMTDAILDDLHNVDVWRSVLAAAPQPEVK